MPNKAFRTRFVVMVLERWKSKRNKKKRKQKQQYLYSNSYIYIFIYIHHLKRQSKNGSMIHMTLKQSLLETKTKMSNTFCSLFVASLTGYAIFSDNEVVFLLRDAYIGGSGGNTKPAGIEPATLTLKLSAKNPDGCTLPIQPNLSTDLLPRVGIGC